MSKRAITILGLLFSILVVEVLILLPGETGPGSSSGKPASAPAPVLSNAPGQVMQDVHVIEAREGGKDWELNAKKGTRPKDGSNWQIEQVEVKFFAKNGVTYNVTGDSGTVTTSATNDVRDVTIIGNVVTHSSNGYVFKTDAAHYDTAKHLLHTPGDLNMTGPREKDGTKLALTGTGMDANLETNDIIIHQNVHGRKTIRAGKVATISSHSALFSGISKQTRFLDDVTIDIETLRITGHEASFVYADGAVDSALVSGGVRVTDSEKYATADRVSVFFNEDKYVFNGSPRVVQSGDELVGEEITFLNNGKQVQVSNARVKLDRKDLEAQRETNKSSQGQKAQGPH